MSVGSQKVTDDVIGLYLGACVNMEKHWKALLLLIASALGAYSGYNSSPPPVHTGDPVAVLALGCLGLSVLLVAYFIWLFIERRTRAAARS